MNDASRTDSSFSAGNDARDLSSVASKWGLCGHQTLPRWLPPNVPGSHLKIPRSGTLQDGQLTLRLASACTLQDIWVHSYSTSWWLIGPALVLGCLSSQGSLGLALGFYCARVRCLNVAHINCKGELGATKHGRSALLPRSPACMRTSRGGQEGARVPFRGASCPRACANASQVLGHT
jgi:hypothetical protein